MKETSFMNFRRPGVVLWSLLPLAGILLLTVLWWTLVYAGSSSADSPLDFALGVLACAVAFLLGLIGLWHGWRFRRSIDAPVERMHATLEAIADGDLEARVRWNGGGELAALANALDRLLDERVVSLDRATRDNEDLNTSVVGIMQAVGTIAATKDLGVRVPVTEDVTGAIADALNLLTEEMSRVLDNVGRLADDVAHAVDALRGQSDRAITAGAREQKEVALAAGELSTAAQALVDVAQSARQVDHFAVQALAETGEAVRVVGATIEGIVQSREQIRRTEKRIKRLGERSQEIGQVVAHDPGDSRAYRHPRAQRIDEGCRRGRGGRRLCRSRRRGQAAVRFGARVGRTDRPARYGDPERSQRYGTNDERSHHRSGGDHAHGRRGEPGDAAHARRHRFAGRTRAPDRGDFGGAGAQEFGAADARRHHCRSERRNGATVAGAIDRNAPAGRLRPFAGRGSAGVPHRVTMTMAQR